MNHIRTALAAAMLAFGTAAVASAQQTTPATPTTRAEHQHRGAHRGPGMNARKRLFDGMTLSTTEQAHVKAVQTKYASQMKALRQQAKPQFEAIRAARQRGDTAAMKQLRTQSAGQRAQTKKLMQQERQDLRSALAPANQTKFDANVAKLQQRGANRGQKFGARRGDTGTPR
jgi:Spy/CpxP family protein refolding chaperone